MESLQANWVWILLGLAAVWFLVRRGDLGPGRSGDGSCGSRTVSDAGGVTDGPHGEPGTGNSPERTARAAASRAGGTGGAADGSARGAKPGAVGTGERRCPLSDRTPRPRTG